MTAPLRLECPGCERLAQACGFRVEEGRLFLTCSRCGAESLAVQAEALAAPSLPAGREGPAVAPAPALESTPPAASPSFLRVLEGGASPAGGARATPPPPARPVEAPPAAPPEVEALFSAPPGSCPKCVAPRPEEALACPACGLVFANFHPDAQRPPAPMAAAWVRLVGRWGETAAHQAFLTQAQAAGQLAAAGRLYRLYRARHPEDAVALRGVEEVVRRALLPSEVRQEAERERPRKGQPLRWVLALLLCALALGLGALFLRAVHAPPPLP